MTALALVAILAILTCASALVRSHGLQASLARRLREEIAAGGTTGPEPTVASPGGRPASRFGAFAQMSDATGLEGRGSLADGGASVLQGARFIVAIVEIDRFHALRRRIGYSLANAVIAALADRLRSQLDRCQVGRVNRTTIEFAFIPGPAEETDARLRALAAALEQHLDVDGHRFDLSVTIGGAEAGESPIDDRLLDRAAAALFEAQRRRAKVHIADAADESPTGRDQLDLMRDLRRAMRDGDLQLHYQPKLRTRTQTVDSAEVLLRWDHPEHGPILAQTFIPIAEETGAIRELTRWVIGRAADDQAWLAANGHDIRMFVNLPGVLLPDEDFATSTLHRLAAACGRMGFELAEAGVIADPVKAIANLRRFADAGIRIAIDDYGSSPSSLACLKQLRAHELKIDRMFISGLTDSQRDPLLARSAIDLAHALEMEVTAEGVEDPIAQSLLTVMGCDQIQGLLVSAPLARAEFHRFLENGAERTPLESDASDDRTGTRVQQG